MRKLATYFKQSTNGQLHSFLPRGFFIIFLQELPHWIWVPPRGIGFPCWKSSRWISLIKRRHTCIGVKTNNQGRKTKRPHPTTLCILLLKPSNVPRYIFNCDRILYSKPMTLTFNTRSVNQDTCIRFQPRTGKRNVIIQWHNLPHHSVSKSNNQAEAKEAHKLQSYTDYCPNYKIISYFHQN